ncbi:tRNA (cytidine(34)-2'-O)-methyltransferase [Caulobacter sp. RL271]|jgi:tRNA (cytidine/uridine-2'-O-)-methyltransferase|uniref:tRNA (cytidine(34)-2'-O)-methyltransferase n=1 Tax=Caulobacter segnis TaxID=88688 RepID=A0ABY5A1N4_9CAUL|nr:tRNA (cytidine(34)-2'-O)-methyltransferase [Caulobacter segnis]USQ98499.1 tRNA (cytidine(34)-2'-O)-methyltransferase [Caulobacter segnis]
MRIALFQPGIPQNVGAAIRLSACFDVGLDVIEPCSFPLDDKSLKRAALDYGPLARLKRHDGWEAFLKAPERAEGRLLLFTTKGATALHRFSFEPGDTLLFGNESRGAPDEVHAVAQGRIVIPIMPDARSMNLATTAAMALGEALRQTDGFPDRI